MKDAQNTDANQKNHRWTSSFLDLRSLLLTIGIFYVYFISV